MRAHTIDHDGVTGTDRVAVSFEELNKAAELVSSRERAEDKQAHVEVATHVVKAITGTIAVGEYEPVRPLEKSTSTTALDSRQRHLATPEAHATCLSRKRTSEVEGDLGVLRSTTNHLVHGFTTDLAEQVPDGEVDGRNGCDGETLRCERGGREFRSQNGTDQHEL